jgi:hypothetical protein
MIRDKAHQRRVDQFRVVRPERCRKAGCTALAPTMDTLCVAHRAEFKAVGMAQGVDAAMKWLTEDAHG